MAGNVGVATGPLLGAVLLAFFGWRTVAVLLVVPLVVAIVAALRLDFEEGAAESDDERDAGVDSLSGFLRQSRRLFVGGSSSCSSSGTRGVVTVASASSIPSSISRSTAAVSIPYSGRPRHKSCLVPPIPAPHIW